MQQPVANVTSLSTDTAWNPLACRQYGFHPNSYILVFHRRTTVYPFVLLHRNNTSLELQTVFESALETSVSIILGSIHRVIIQQHHILAAIR